jgi:3-oxoacyl-[acyl-carrier protein] reductase
MMIDLTGKVALVTGGSRGIGLAIAERLHGAGTHTAILARDGARAEAAAAGLAGPGRTVTVAADVGKAVDVETALARVEQELGPVDILVNNAGFTRDGLLVRMSERDWDDVINVNLKGAFNTMRLVARSMIKRRWGRIINITSIVGLAGNRGQANYTAAKAGLVGLTKAMAKELASRNVLVNAIAPGFVDTDLTRGLSDEQRKVLLDQIPQGRLGRGADVAGAVLFLASDLADYITGQVLIVSGGMVM